MTLTDQPVEMAVVGDMNRHIGRFVRFYSGTEYRVLDVGPVVNGEREITIELARTATTPGGEVAPAGAKRTISAFIDEYFPVRDDPENPRDDDA